MVANRFRLQPTVYAPSQASTARSRLAGCSEAGERDARERTSLNSQGSGERIHLLSQDSRRSVEPVGAG